MTGTWVNGIAAITLFVEDLAATREFYQRAFELPVHFEDDSSVVFAFGGTLLNLLDVQEAPELVAPESVGGPQAGARSQLTIHVADVDAACSGLVARGVELLSGPMDRPWGIRTASFRDPAGHVWELAQ
jgi:catechol 2,3-dioxygenase-like lactoylglutathione lyase family enzyme